MSSLLPGLEKLLAISEAMLSAAGVADWEALASHEAERRAVADQLPGLLNSALSATAQERARILIEACLRCDARIHPLVLARQNELRVVLREARPGA